MSRLHVSIRAVVAASSLLLLSTPSAFAALGDCGQPISNGVEPTTADALYVLRASVGTSECELCVCDVDNSGVIVASDALHVLRRAVGLTAPNDCPDCLPQLSECPGVAQFALFANVRPGSCATNAECAGFSTCDTTLGRCRTLTESDVGWNGLAHDADIDDPIPARVFLDCEGPAPCGECLITGHDPSLGNCRCANDNQKKCFTVSAPDEQDCGGEKCICYFGPPMPLSAGNTPVCVLNSLASQPGGDANVDQGSGTINLHLSEVIYLGESLLSPCPVCINDTTPADGMRNGVCVGGLNATEGCDAQAVNTTFPPPTGAFYSLDCFPLPGADISNGGLPLNVDLTTGMTTLEANLPCAEEGPLAELECHCRVCSGDSKLGCRSDAECAEAGAGTCSSNGGGEQTLPNGCTEGICQSDNGGSEGACANGPDDTWCDGIVRANGDGLIGCGSNVDCDPTSIGIDAGLCALTTRRECFLPTIVSQGAPHPSIPLAAGTYCLAASASESVNSAAGLPGPGRLTLQTAVTLFCESDPLAVYTPGVGGCPDEAP